MESRNELEVAYDGNRLILNDQKLRTEFSGSGSFRQVPVDHPPTGTQIPGRFPCFRGIGFPEPILIEILVGSLNPKPEDMLAEVLQRDQLLAARAGVVGDGHEALCYLSGC